MDEAKFKRGLDLFFRTEGTQDVRNATELLIRIFRNVLAHPNEEKYRKLRVSSGSLQEKIWRFNTARQLFFASGWYQEEEFLVLPANRDVRPAINILTNNRVLSPESTSWEAPHFEGKSEKQIREERLKAEANIEKKKQLAEFKADKAQRQILGELIKAEHKADQERVNLLRRVLPDEKSHHENPAKENSLQTYSEDRSLR